MSDDCAKNYSIKTITQPVTEAKVREIAMGSGLGSICARGTQTKPGRTLSSVHGKVYKPADNLTTIPVSHATVPGVITGAVSGGSNWAFDDANACELQNAACASTNLPTNRLVVWYVWDDGSEDLESATFKGKAATKTDCQP